MHDFIQFSTQGFDQLLEFGQILLHFRYLLLLLGKPFLQLLVQPLDGRQRHAIGSTPVMPVSLSPTPKAALKPFLVKNWRT